MTFLPREIFDPRDPVRFPVFFGKQFGKPCTKRTLTYIWLNYNVRKDVQLGFNPKSPLELLLKVMASVFITNTNLFRTQTILYFILRSAITALLLFWELAESWTWDNVGMYADVIPGVSRLQECLILWLLNFLLVFLRKQTF